MSLGSVSPLERQWLDLISFAEGTYDPSRGGTQYDIMFGGGRFSDLSRHPDKVISSGGYNSAAAGAYQFMPQTWAGVSKKLGLKGFGPEQQDLAALELIRQRGVDPSRDPITKETVARLAPEWASLPTLSGKSYYGQPVRKLEELTKFAGSSALPTASSTAPSEERSTRAADTQRPAATEKSETFEDKLRNKMLASLISEPLLSDKPIVPEIAPPPLPSFVDSDLSEVDQTKKRISLLLSAITQQFSPGSSVL